MLSYSFKLPYGLRKTGEIEELVHISEIRPYESGLKCNCICPSCGEKLQAKLPKTKEDFTSRFAHHNADTCEYATETAIHMKAKEIIEREKKIVLPEVSVYYKDLYKEISPKRQVNFDRVILERRISNIVPDVIAYKDDRPLMIEITITHGIDEIKNEKIKELGISTLEIDLSDLDTNFDPVFLQDEIILKTDRKYWIYNTLVEREKEILKEEYLLLVKKKQEEEKKVEERKIRLEQYREERRKGKPKRIKLLLEKDYQSNLKKEWEVDFFRDPIWISAAKGLRISSSSIPRHLNVEIPGEIVFGCDRRVWQAYIFYRYVHNKVVLFKENTFPITVKRIQENIKTDFRGKLIDDLVFLKDVREFENVPDLTKVIYDYLKKLEEYGYLEEEAAGHIFYTKFHILEPGIIYELRYVPNSLPEYKTIEALIKENNWEKCKELIKELLIKYDQSNQSEYFNGLGILFDGVVIKSGGTV